MKYFKEKIKLIAIYSIPTTLLIITFYNYVMDGTNSGYFFMIFVACLSISIYCHSILVIREYEKTKDIRIRQWLDSIEIIEKGRLFIGKNLMIVEMLPEEKMLCISNKNQWLLLELWNDSYIALIDEIHARYLLSKNINKYEQYFGVPELG